MSSISVVFLGPTLASAEVAAICEAQCLPPAAQGDVYRAAQRMPRAIGIIDGYFCGAPSVWHKEILWALSQGIAVFGSASMGALRAAELHSFGMRGVGRIFAAYRDGMLEDDDDVALIHGPSETGFMPLSEPMVNIRATLALAEREGRLSASTRQGLEGVAKSLFYSQRTWPAILEGAPALGARKSELAAFGAWLPHGRVDQKREDALAMLAAMNEAAAAASPPDPLPGCGFHFERTHFWDEMVARAAGERLAGQPEMGLGDAAIIDELRLQGGDAYGQARIRALLRLFAGLHADQRGVEATPEAVRARLKDLRAKLGLFSRAQLDAWLLQNGIDAPSLERLVEEETCAQAVAALPAAALAPHLVDELRLSGAYAGLAERARRKRLVLAGPDTDAAQASLPTAVELRHWFARRLGQPSLADDAEELARSLGFTCLADFDGALRHEWLFLQRARDYPKAPD